MEDEKKKTSFPSNYVTLCQLQERWLKEKQLKQQQEQDHHNAVTRTVSEIVVIGGVDSADQVGEEGEEAKSKKKKKKKCKGNKLQKEVVGEGIEVQFPLANDEKGEMKKRGNQRSRPKKGEFRAERADIDTKFRVSSAMVEKEVAGKEVVVQTPLTEGNRKDISGMRNRRIGKISTRIKAKVGDSSMIYVRVEKGIPENEAVAVNVNVNENGEKEQVSGRRSTESRGKGKTKTKTKTRAESSNLNQRAHNKSVSASANGRKIYLTLEEGHSVNHGSRSENQAEGSDLNHTADVALKLGGLPGTRSDLKAEIENNGFDQIDTIVPKFSVFSLNGGTGENGNGLRRTSAHHYRGYRESSRYGYKSFPGRAVHKLENTRMVWMKKEEVSGGNVSGTQKPSSRRPNSGF
ncbi:hypothetical protein CsatA_029565 [Cannabis sativa]